VKKLKKVIPNRKQIQKIFIVISVLIGAFTIIYGLNGFLLNRNSLTEQLTYGVIREDEYPIKNEIIDNEKDSGMTSFQFRLNYSRRVLKLKKIRYLFKIKRPIFHTFVRTTILAYIILGKNIIHCDSIRILKIILLKDGKKRFFCY